MEPGAVVAAAFVAAAGAEGLAPDHRLRLLRWAPGPAPITETVDGPDELGPLLERLRAPDDRRRTGAWYTPRWLAEQLVATACAGTEATPESPVVDPACGGGVFLLAAVRHLRVRGVDAATAVRSVWGADLDDLAIAVTEAALWWWSAHHGAPTVAGHRLEVGDALTGLSVPSAAAVVGNPPFRGQLRDRSWNDAGERRRLKERFGGVVGAYTDPAWLFPLAALDWVRPGGAVAMLQPQSFLAARDGGRVRNAIETIADLEACWIDAGGAFDAAVDVCAPRLRKRAPGSTRVPVDWVAPLADALGVPDVRLDAAGVLGDRAEVRAGFRDEFYGLVDALAEGGDGPVVVTSGAIDPFRLRSGWPIRIGGRTWAEPRVVPDALAGRAADWVRAQRRPKVVVASQTRVVEAVADPDGSLVASVPVVVLLPAPELSVWHVLAVLQAPAVSAWLLRRSAGTALSRDACRPTAPLLRDLPLPVSVEAWDRAAALAAAVAAGDHSAMGAFAEAAGCMYGIDDPVMVGWWRDRLPRR